MNNHSALVIFSNPYALCISIGQQKEDEGGLFAFGISHGEERKFRWIVTTDPFAKTLDEVIECIKSILITSKVVCSGGLTSPDSVIADIPNPGLEEIDQSLVLNDELIERILEKLRVERCADTSTLLPRLSVKIISTPPGMAPEWVRAEWIDMILPVSLSQSRGIQLGLDGSAPQNLGGYQVDTITAIETLKEKSPKAAAWWETSFPLQSTTHLVFRKDVCELIK